MATFSNQSRNKRLLMIGGIGFIVVAILFFVIGFVSKSSDCDESGSTTSGKKPESGKMTDEERNKVHQSIVEFMKTSELKENMNFFAKKPHVASTSRTFENSDEIYRRFKEYGFEPSFHNYTTILAYSKLDNPNYIAAKEGGKEIFRSMKIETTYPEYGEIEAESLPPFLAYSMNGTATGKDLIYVNFGLDKDFKFLKDEMNVSFTDKIVLTKYGKSRRGNKVRMAEKYGAAGILIYGDPQQYAPVSSEKFPYGRWLSDDGVQRGSIIGGEGVPEGDPMSDGYPAKDWAYRPEKIEDVKGISKIPAQPIAASDAEKLLRLLGGDEVKSEWRGNLNVTYRYGPQTNTTAIKFDLVVNNINKITGIRNVCGKMLGEVEPDRYVLLGNHIDSWVYGSVDATSGTTVMMEIARALGQKYKEGWRPRRSIMLCGWDGEESGLIGSVEHVEEYYSQLHDKAVAYINIDSAVAGNNSLLTSASPLLHDMMFDVHKQVPDPYRDETVFDRCMIEYKDKNYNKTHKIGYLGAGSDYFAFYKFMGIPSIDMGYRQSDLDKLYNTSYYPQYHTLHDTIYWMETFVDREYKIHLTVAKVGLLYLLQLADTPIIPFTFQRYDDVIKRGVDALEKKIVKDGKDPKQVAAILKPLHDGIESFSKAVKSFRNYIDNVKKEDKLMDNPLFVRMLNDKIMQLEKGFTYPKGVPGRSQLKHYLMTSSINSADRYCPLPALSDLLPALMNGEKMEEFKIQISITTSLIRAVAESLSADIM